MDDHPSVAEGATFYDVDRQCRMKYVGGEWQRMSDGSRATDEMVAVDDPAATDPTVLDILRAHEWDRRAEGCACGWSQGVCVGRVRRDLQLNHPYHVMHMLKTRSLYYPPAIEFSPEWGDSFRWDRPLRWK